MRSSAPLGVERMNLHEFLDWRYGSSGDEQLRGRLSDGEDPEARFGEQRETALHVATRRRRLGALKILIEHGVDKDARTAGGKTAYAHAVRRGFTEIAGALEAAGCDTSLAPADRLAVAVVGGDLEEAKRVLNEHPSAIRTGNPEEDRLLGDIAGRDAEAEVLFLIRAGADVVAPSLDNGSPLHIAAWFGQPRIARHLIDAGAPLNIFDISHQSSPLGWAVHGSRYSGGAEEREGAYAELTEMLLAAGSNLHYPGEANDRAYLRRLLDDATPRVRAVLEAYAER